MIGHPDERSTHLVEANVVGEAAGADSVEETESAETVDIALIAQRVTVSYSR